MTRRGRTMGEIDHHHIVCALVVRSIREWVGTPSACGRWKPHKRRPVHSSYLISRTEYNLIFPVQNYRTYVVLRNILDEACLANFFVRFPFLCVDINPLHVQEPRLPRCSWCPVVLQQDETLHAHGNRRHQCMQMTFIRNSESCPNFLVVRDFA